MSNTSRHRRTVGSVAALVITITSVLVASALLFNRQYILDNLSVWQYKPSPIIQTFVDRAGMNKTGEFYFFASQPTLEGRPSFNARCANHNTETAVLGCYKAQRIYIYDVQNEKLDGIRTVTAAHEMLHAAYDRLSDDERARVDAMVETEYEKLKQDERWVERMAFYAKTQPGERNNELHSMIGTELSSINPNLESYYGQYFDDRRKVIDLQASYEAVFTSLQARSAQLASQLDALQSSIEQGTTSYNAQVAQLNRDIQEFNERADSGDFDSQAEFDAERSRLIVRSGQLDTLREQINSEMTRFETLQKELESIASQSDVLNRSINSNLAPPPSL